MTTQSFDGIDRLSALEQENALLRSRLQTCEQSYALLQAELAQLRQQEQMLKPSNTHFGNASWPVASDVSKRSLDLLATDPDLNNFVGHVLTAIAQQFQSPLTEYWSQDDHTAYVELIYWQGQILDRAAIASIFPCHAGLEGFRVPLGLIEGVPLSQRKNPIVYENHGTNPFTKDLEWVIHELIPQGLPKEINVPLFWGDTTIGALTIHVHQDHQFTHEQVVLAQSLAHQVTLAVQLQRLADEAQQVAMARTREKAAQERLLELAKANQSLQRSLEHLTHDANLDAFLGHVLLEITQRVNAESVHIFLYDAPTNTLRFHISAKQGQIAHAPQPDEPEIFKAPFDADITPAFRHMCQRRTMISLNEDEFNGMAWPGTVEWFRRDGVTEACCLALMAGDHPVGLLGMRFLTERQLSPKIDGLVHALSYQATLAIQLTTLAEEAKQAALAREQEKAAQERAAELATINEALILRDRLLAVVAQVTQGLLENPNVEQGVAQALQKLGEASGASRMTLFHEKPEPQTGRLQHHILLEWTLSNVPRLMDNPDTCSLYSDDYPDIAAELHAGRSTSLHLKDYPSPAPAFWAKFGVHSRSIVPILIEGEYFGCVCFDDCFHNHPWSEQEMDILTAGAGAIGAALLRQRLTEKAKQSAIVQEQLRAAELAKANDALKRSLNAIAIVADPSQIIAHILKIVAEQFDTPLVEYWLHSEDFHTAHISLSCWQGEILTAAEQPDHPGNANFPSLRSLSQPDSSTHSPYFLIDDIRIDPYARIVAAQIGIDIGAWFQRRGVTRLLNIPLWLNEQTIGALDIWLPSDRPFTQSQIELAHTFGQQITLTSYLNHLFEEAQQTVLFEERNRIASDIHDTLAQAFTGISLQLEVAKPLIHQEPETVSNILGHISQLAKNGLAEARRSVWALYPPGEEYANLAQMLYDSVEQMSRNTSIEISVNLLGEPCPLTPYIGMNLLRIGQETLTNALKHSQAQTILIDLVYESDRLLLSVRDDGCGFIPPTTIDACTGGFGLISMYERCDRIGAQLTILSQPGCGTNILVESPLC